MKHLRILCAILLMAVNAAMANAQEPQATVSQAIPPEPPQLVLTLPNYLVFQDIKVQAGKAARLPIALENNDEVAAMQFDLTLPSGIKLDGGVTLSTRAKTTHQVTANQLVNNDKGDNVYRVVVVSKNAKVIRGNADDLLYFDVQIPKWLSSDQEYKIQISNLLLSDADGESLTTLTKLGVINIATMPDLKISGLATAETEIGPNSTVKLWWNVTNIGDLPTTGGWSEEITLVGLDGASKYLGTVRYSGKLQSGETATRSTTVTLPSIPTVDSEALFNVKVVPNSDCGEPKSALNNNEMNTDKTVFVNKLMWFDFPSEKSENYYNPRGLRGSVTRSGSRVEDQTFKLSISPADPRIVLPSKVKIPAGQSKAYFTYYIINNNKLDDNSDFVVTLDGTANDYGTIVRDFKLIDDERPRLFIALDKSVVSEGETFKITVTSERAPASDLTVRLRASKASRFKIPATVTIPAGKTTVVADGMAVDNTVAELDETYSISTSASGYSSQSAKIKIIDDDMPQLGLAVSPTVISEGDTESDFHLTVSRSTNIDRRVVVKLTNSNKTDVYMSKSQVVMEAGVDHVDVALSPRDNGKVENHQRFAKFTAQVYLQPNDIYASSATQGYATAQVEILDDDGLTLSMSPNRSTWIEGGSGTLYISRNTLSEESPAITITLTGDHDDRVSYKKTVVMDAKATSVSVPVSIARNTVTGDDVEVMFTAEASDYTKAVCSVLVSDKSLPDAVMSSFTLSSSSVEITSPFTATAVIRNDGYDVLPADTRVTVYGGGNVVATTTIGSSVDINKEVTLTFPLTASASVGSTGYYAVVNEGSSFKEMTYKNNKSKTAYLYTSPGFTTTLTTDKKLYNPGETVYITGQATGNHAADAPILIYIMWGSQTRHTITTSCDINGRFTAEWEPFAGLAGHVSLGATHPNVYSSAEQAGIDIYGLRLTSKNNLYFDVEEEHDVNHDIKIYNPGPDLTGVKAEVVKCPDNCTVVLNNAEIAVMKSGASATIPMTITNTKPSAKVNYDEIVVKITSNEGPQVESHSWLHCRYHKAHLQLSPSRYDLTLVKGKSRQILVDITNVGLRETGKISWTAQKWVTDVSPIGSIQPGETVTATLTLTAPEDSHLMDPYPASRVSFVCENGDGASMLLGITVVSTDKGRFILTASDDHTYNKPGHVHLSGADVTITHPLTGEVLYTGVTGDDGKFVIDEMVEGYYNIKVTCNTPKAHKPFYQSRYLVNPGVDNELEAMLWLKVGNLMIYPDPANPGNDDDDDGPGGGEVVFDVDIDMDTDAPAITMSMPKERPALNVVVPFNVTNEGSVPVGRTEISFLVPAGYEMEIIDRPFANLIPAHSTVTFYGVLRPTSDDADPTVDCFTLGATTHAQYACGPFTQVIETTVRRAWGSCTDLSDWLDEDPDPSSPGGDEPKPSLPSAGRFDIDGIANSVSLQLSRTVMMTGQTINAWLTIDNKTAKRIEEVAFDMQILDCMGNAVGDSLFSCELKSLTGGLSGVVDLNSVWTLDSRTRGVADIGVTPSFDAAENMPKLYYIGGTMHYTDPTTGAACSVRLTPIPVYVNPKPKLDLDYFLQRDIFGDDLATHNVIEPSLPAEFSLLIANNGSGSASKVNVVTHRPRVTHYTTRDPIDIRFVGSQLNGSDITLTTCGDITTPFGTIKNGETAYAQWWMTCNFLGHFVEYDHVNTRLVADDLDQSVIGDISVHELIHSLHIDMAAKRPLKGFMVNDDEDDEDLPDRMYLTDGDTVDVHLASKARFTSSSLMEYTLQVTPGKAGWNYGKVGDPTRGRQKLKSVVRTSDGKEIDIQNFWQTDRTMPDDAPPVTEYLIHFADLFTDSVQVYKLTFEYTPDMTLDVKAFEGVPATVQEDPVQTIDVVFNKDIDAETFSADDLSLTCQGNLIEPLDIAITAKDQSSFTIDVSKHTTANGVYILAVNTEKIIDSEGFAGKDTRFAEWMQYAAGTVNLTVNVEPAESGTATPDSGPVKYGAKTVLAATPLDGYEFSHWTCGDEIVSRDAEMSKVLYEDTEYTAHFAPRRYYVEVIHDGGTVDGAGTGYYGYGDQLDMKAKSQSGYHYDGWVVAGEPAGRDKKMSVSVTDDMVIEACFTKKNTDVVINVPADWSWITPNVSAPEVQEHPEVFLATAIDRVERFVDIAKELVYDPAYDCLVGNLSFIEPQSSYKLQMSAPGMISLFTRIAMNDEIRVEVKQGWNWMGYVPSMPMYVDVAFADLQPEDNDIVKSQSAFSTFADGKWHGEVQILQPNEGYMYYSGKNGSFHYPNNNEAIRTKLARTAIAHAPGNEPWKTVDAHQYSDNTTIIASLESDDAATPLDAYTVGAFAAGECRGIGRWIDGRLFITVHGTSRDGRITFRAYNSLTGDEFAVKEFTDFGVGHLGTFHAPYMLHVDTTTGIGAVASTGYSVYPVPAHTKLFISGNTQAIKALSLVSMAGTLVGTATGYDPAEGVDVASLAPGNYLIGIATDSGTVYRRFVKQ